MKKWILILNFLTFLLVATGCGANPSWVAHIEQMPVSKDGNLIVRIEAEGTPLTGLNVVGIFEMAQMDHGTFEISFVEQQSGIYEAQLKLPMPGEWLCTLRMSNDGETVEQNLEFDIPATGSAGDHHSSKHEVDGAVATVNGEGIFAEDIQFYQLINQLQIAIKQEADLQTSDGKELEEAMKSLDSELDAANNINMLLNQAIRLRAMALLALEKGHKATEEEINNEVNKVRQELAKSKLATKLIKQFGEEKFWAKQQSQYEMIVLANKVQEDIIKKIKEKKPDTNMQEVNFYAQKEYEELLVSQVEALDIEIFIK